MYFFFTNRTTLIVTGVFLVSLLGISFFLGVTARPLEGVFQRSLYSNNVFAAGRTIPFGFIVFLVFSFTLFLYTWHYFNELPRPNGTSISRIILFFSAIILFSIISYLVWYYYFPTSSLRTASDIENYNTFISSEASIRDRNLIIGHSIYVLLLFFVLIFYVLTILSVVIYHLF